jgi:hypothetical protein
MALKQLIALTEIHMTVTPGKAGDPAKGLAPVRPKTKTIPNGAQFKAQSEEQEAEFIEMRAARPVEADDEILRGSRLYDVTTPETNTVRPVAGAEPAKPAETVESKVDEANVGEGQTSPDAKVDEAERKEGNAADVEQPALSDLDRLRAEYEEVFGEAPNGNLKEAGLKKRIAEKREAAKADDAEGDDTDGMV